MSNLGDFLNMSGGQQAPAEEYGVDWSASVRCQVCMEPVSTQTLYMDKALLVWKCSKGHRSKIENYTAF